jgi:hypothetical protein
MPYWSAEGTRICTYSDARTARKIVYEIPSGNAAVGANGSYYDKEKSCRIIADAASIETCDAPANNHEFESDHLYRGSGDRLSQRWVAPDVVKTPTSCSRIDGLDTASRLFDFSTEQWR